LRIAFFSPPLWSHLAVYRALAGALAKRGHGCFLIGHPDLGGFDGGSLALAALDPAGCAWNPESVTANARRPGLPFGILRVVNDMAAMTRSLCLQGPALLRELGIDGVVSDQMESAGAIVAEHLNLPFVTVASALPVNREPSIPLPVLDWPWEDSAAALKRNRGGEWVADLLTRRIDRTIAAEAGRLGCAPKRRQADCLSPLAEIGQIVPGFDFPRRNLPAHFHPVGPLRDGVRGGAPLPPIPSGKPLVFCSFGTLQGHRLGLFRRVAKACRQVGTRLLAAHCGGLSPEQATTVDADWVVDRVDQEEAVRRADVVVTHGGLNTALDALAAGTPMLVIPLAFDQPGVAARVRHLGAGEVVSSRPCAATLAQALGRLLSDKGFGERAGSLKHEFVAAGGAARAASVIEQALCERRPVPRQEALAA
jgi:zeaxanthin glucosyltransferase